MTEYFVNFGIKDAVDVVCVALLLFSLYRLMKRSGSLNMFIGILVFIFVWMLVSQVFKMQLLGAILDKLVDVGVIAIIVLFAEDIRRFFRDIGTTTRTRRIFHWMLNRKVEEGDITRWQPVIRACESMSSKKEGALIVIGSDEELRDVKASGEEVNAALSQLLIENIFFKNSPLHDGAMIIIGDRIEAAACILPVSQSDSLPKQFGLRHRAAMGVSERTDATVIVVSEETGHITAFHKGEFTPLPDREAMEKYLAQHVR
ncbi:MAG: diadenylate cyclase CdaA [Bacteroidaceae bacterium]|nr:diadenylate cyclase CdaA [Bacteroidaceae bacterium]